MLLLLSGEELFNTSHRKSHRFKNALKGQGRILYSEVLRRLRYDLGLEVSDLHDSSATYEYLGTRLILKKSVRHGRICVGKFSP